MLENVANLRDIRQGMINEHSRGNNGCANPLIYLHGDAIINQSWVCDSSTAWPQLHIVIILTISMFHIEPVDIVGLVTKILNTAVVATYLVYITEN